MKQIVSLVMMLTLTLSLSAQKFSYRWERVAMDSTYEGSGSSPVEEIIVKYYPGIEELMEIIGYSESELSKRQPESSLSNLAADVILATASPYLKEGDKALSLTNFGGIRSELPKGAIRTYDVFSVFPFDNKIVIVEIKGSELKKLLNSFAKREQFQAMGGVQIEVKSKKMTKCLIGGSPLDENKIYKLATIDFLLDGGDYLNLRKSALNIINTEVFIRDAVVKYIKDKTAQGIVLSGKKDGRIVINK